MTDRVVGSNAGSSPATATETTETTTETTSVLTEREYRVRDVKDFSALIKLRNKQLRVKVYDLDVVRNMFAEKAISDAEMDDGVYKVVVEAYYTAKYFRVVLTRIGVDPVEYPAEIIIYDAELAFNDLQMLNEFLEAVFRRTRRSALFWHEIKQFLSLIHI